MPNSFLYPWKSMRYSNDNSNKFLCVDEINDTKLQEQNKEEIAIFLDVINETLEKYNRGFLKDDINSFNGFTRNSNPCFLLAELYQPDTLESNSKSIIYDQGNLCNLTDCERLLSRYYKLIEELHQNYKCLLSLNRAWYFQPKIYYQKVANENANEYKKVKGKLFTRRETIESLSEKKITESKENDIESLIDDYSNGINKIFFDKFKYSYFLFIPIGLNKIPYKTHSRKIIGACFLHFGFNEEVTDIENIFGDLFQNINTYINSFYTSESFELRLNEIQQVATRAAISQVMARNMSHNIGSHVMNKLTGNLNDYKIYDTERYVSCDMETLYKDKFIEKRKEGLNDEQIKDNLKNEILLDQISTFNNYVKCRMDYLSDVTFGTPLMQTNKKFYGELFKDFDKVRLLLNNISGLSDFEFEIQFIRTVYDESNKPYTKKIDNSDDLAIAIPNDVLGCQAFYNIIENTIRNTAKHNQNKNKNRRTVFTVNLHTKTNICSDRLKKAAVEKHINVEETLDLLDTMYMVEIYDNIPVEIDIDEKKKNDFYRKDTADIKSIDWLVCQQNKKINTSILQENHSLRTHSLGIIEMEASAAYLRKMEITDIDADAYDIDYDPKKGLTNTLKLPVLRAFDKDGCLGYRFYVHKPQEILLVGNFEISENEEVVKKLLQDGVWIKTKHEFKEELEANRVYNHQFVLYKDIDLENIIKEYKTSLPTRTLYITAEKAEELNQILNSYNDFQNLELFIWNWWSKSFNKVFSLVKSNDTDTTTGYRIYLMDHLDKNLWELALSNSIDYIEPLSSLAQRKLPGNNYPDFTTYLREGLNDKNYNENNYNEKCTLKPNYSRTTINRNKIIESSFSKICVVDERIQDFSNKKSPEDIDYTSIFSQTNILIPDKTLNLAASNYDADIIKKIHEFIENNINDIKFILIHYSILERIDQDGIFTNLLKWQKMNPNAHIVITSGRGRPKNLPDFVRFVNLSPVLSAFTEIRCKYLIYNLLNSSRK